MNPTVYNIERTILVVYQCFHKTTTYVDQDFAETFNFLYFLSKISLYIGG